MIKVMHCSLAAFGGSRCLGRSIRFEGYVISLTSTDRDLAWFL